MNTEELGVITLAHEDPDIFIRSIILYFLNNKYHDNKIYHWIMHNANSDIINAAHYCANLLKPINIVVHEINNNVNRPGWINEGHRANGGNEAIAELIKNSSINYWMKIDQDIFHITPMLTDDLFSKCKILHNLHKKNFGFITPFININCAMVPIFFEKMKWINPEHNWEKYNSKDFTNHPWWQPDFQTNIWEQTSSLLQQSEILKDGAIVNPPLSKVTLSIGNIVFPKYSFVKMHSVISQESAWWETFTNQGIFVDTSHLAAHYSYWNARNVVNEKYRTKIFNMLDEVINARLKIYSEFATIILEINKILEIPIYINNV